MHRVSTLVGVCLGAFVFTRIVSGRSDVSMRNWKGVLVYTLLALGSVTLVELIVELLGKL